MVALKTILYFSIFKYPITEREILKFTNIDSISSLKKELSYLHENGIIFKIDDYYLDTNCPEWIRRREKGNEMANRIMPKALKVSKLISKFPFVEGVSLSGSLSKGYFDEEGDIDFFITTRQNRLWISRTLLVLYKKLFLLNSRKYFCVNYFVSSRHLEISEKNRFTATELVTLRPIYGKRSYEKLIESNAWVDTYFPNHIQGAKSPIFEVKKGVFVKTLEKLLGSRLGDSLEALCHKLTLNRWQRKFAFLSKEDFEVAFKSTKNVSKHHPQNFQKKIIEILNNKTSLLNNQFNLDIRKENV